ncbi:hypothetical protein B8W73_01635 [Arthrobacter agilis]|nr:hypothetical protein B8W73_01635 [Arthrobacter agilis]
MRLAACGAGAAAVLFASTAVPANAASTQGRQFITFDRCITDEEVGLVLCTTGTEERIEVHTPSGRVIVQGRVQSSSTTTYGGETTTAGSAYKSVSVFEWYVDGLIFDAQTIKLKGTGTMGFPDGVECVFETDFIAVDDESKFDHGSVTCTFP